MEAVKFRSIPAVQNMSNCLHSVGIGAVLCVLLLSGCIQSGGTYYSVSSTEGKIVGNACGGLAGPPNTLRLARGNSEISVTPPNDESDRFLAVRIRVHSGDVIRVDLSQIELLDSNLKNIVKERTLYVFDWKSSKFIKLESTEELTGVRLTSSGGGFSEYEIAVELDEVPPVAFTFTLPDIVSNGIKTQGVAIKFVKTKGRWVSPINC